MTWIRGENLKLRRGPEVRIEDGDLRLGGSSVWWASHSRCPTVFGSGAFFLPITVDGRWCATVALCCAAAVFADKSSSADDNDVFVPFYLSFVCWRTCLAISGETLSNGPPIARYLLVSFTTHHGSCMPPIRSQLLRVTQSRCQNKLTLPETQSSISIYS